MREATNVAVIGAGPSGLIAAREAAKRGFDVAVFEEDSEVGVPCHCAGLLSLDGLKEIQVPFDDGFVQNKVRGAHFLSPCKLSFTVERREPVACVVNRSSFDKFLAAQAVHAGAILKLNSRVRRIRRVGGRISIVGDFGEVKADVVIDAEGVPSRLIKQVGLRPLPAQHLLPAFQCELTGTHIDKDYVEIHTGRELAPEFFAWVIPLSGDSARIGLACKGASPLEKLDMFIKDRFKGENVNKIRSHSGLVVTSGPIPRTFHDNFIAVGDVAGQVKPTTGGGVIWGGMCAMIAGETAAEAAEAEALSRDFLASYETRWRRRLGNEVRLTLLARRMIDSLSDGTIDRIFEIVRKSNLHLKLSAEGKMDFQAASILRLMSNMAILRVLASSLGDLKKAMIAYIRDHSILC
ncbi:MAG: NAD(P)/FAD-dependent oxidoreductase [Candidatus Bathyarchaeota archaeon]|nr:NAD(P)/FAD-dependent oxidoreductase [Candidatus Bathyarchaeota archaeon]